MRNRKIWTTTSLSEHSAVAYAHPNFEPAYLVKLSYQLLYQQPHNCDSFTESNRPQEAKKSSSFPKLELKKRGTNSCSELPSGKQSKSTRKLRGTCWTEKTSDQAILEGRGSYLRRTQLLHLADCVRLPELQGKVDNFLNSTRDQTPQFTVKPQQQQQRWPGRGCL